MVLLGLARHLLDSPFLASRIVLSLVAGDTTEASFSTPLPALDCGISIGGQ
jgi:hypothetical protein